MKRNEENMFRPACWLCGGREFKTVKKSTLREELSSRHVAITDCHYGVTGTLCKCRACGFIQCIDLHEVLPLYEALVDEQYEDGRSARALQARRLLESLPGMAGRRLLDVGAGAGILVEEATSLGAIAQGVEPCRWLQQRAHCRGLDVVEGTLPHPDVTGPYDVITVVDVIEHVTDPLGLLRTVHRRLSEDGILLVVTPDISSVAARILGHAWWHYRIAHIGYFNRRTLRNALSRAGFDLVRITRPCWYFPADYLWTRGMQYLPAKLRVRTPLWLSRRTIPLNPRDSIAAICRKKREGI